MQYLLWVSSLFLITTLFLPSSIAAICSANDRAALLVFKTSILKDTTGIMSTWTGRDCCNGGWEGIECDATGSVNRLILQRPASDSNKSIFMKGILSPSLGNLRSLEVMVISGMARISGTIPGSFANLTRLTSLVLDDNSLQGNIPSSLSRLTNLQTVSLSGNQLTGQIPPSFGYLRNLLQLSLARNLLTGPIPLSFTSLIRLQSLDLSFNSLYGPIPDFLGRLRNLTYLVLSKNQLSGQIPISLCSLTGLSELSIDQNQLTGKIPTQIGNLKSVSVLKLSSNKFNGQIPESISQLHNLWNLNLSRNLLTNLLPSLVFEMGLPSLSSIDLSYNDFDLGEVPKWIRTRELSDVHLAGCKLRGSLPNFTRPGSLSTLDLSDNYFTQGILNFLSRMTSLQSAKISNNLLIGDLSTIRLPDQISSLDLHSNRLFGSLSMLSDTTTNKFLESVDLSRNEISSTIPEFRGASKLKVLNLASNKIGGHIPSSISNTGTLEMLDISRNNITGKIPPSLGLRVDHLTFFQQWLMLIICACAGNHCHLTLSFLSFFS